MRDSLIGYLLGALTPEEHAQVAQFLLADREAQHALEILRRGLVLLEAKPQEFEVPGSLTVRTLERIRYFAGCEELPPS